MNTATSDTDYKGIFVATKKYYYGIHEIEQKDKGWDEPGNGNFPQLDGNKDTVAYELRKFIKLASKCNPNILELLYEREDMYLWRSTSGHILCNNRDLFLSRKVKHTYAGYAYAQLRKIRVHRKWLLEPQEERPRPSEYGLEDGEELTKEQLNAFLEFVWILVRDRIEFFEEQKELYVLLQDRIDIKATLLHHPLPAAVQPVVQQYTRASDEFMRILTKTQQYRQALNEWKNYQSWKKNRNESRAELERKCGYDSKHAGHLIRLLRMGLEILKTGEVKVFRPDCLELLSIRQGDWPYNILEQYAEELFLELDEAYETSILPSKVNMNRINDLQMELVERAIG